MSCPNPKLLRNFFFCLCLDIFQEGRGGLPNAKLFEELFCLCLDIFQEGGGGLPDSKKLRNFSACVWNLFRKGGGGGSLFQNF